MSAVSSERLVNGSHRRRSKPWKAIFAFIAPALIFYVVFTLYPLASTFYYAFHRIEPVRGELVTTFVGLENFQDLATDRIFRRSVQNTLIWGTAGPTLEVVTALGLALLVYFRVPFYRFYRIAWFTPMLVSGVIVGLVFRWIFNYDWGLLNEGLRALGLDQLAVNWLGRRDTPLAVVIFVHYWSTFGFSFVLILAGLSTIPEELIESARLDGANVFNVIARVIIPMLMPTLITVLISVVHGQDARLQCGVGIDGRGTAAL